MSKIRVVLADDHELFLEGLKTVLTAVPNVEIIGSATNGNRLLELVAQSTADLVVLDLNIPGKDGLKCIRQIKANHPEVKILVITNYNQPELMDESRKLGANGFLVKDSSASEIIDAVSKVVAGESYFPKLNPTTVLDENSYFFDDFLKKFKLTRREVEIIRLVCKEYSTKEIADLLSVSEFTVATHRKNIQKKLNLKNIAGWVSFAKENQLVH